MGIIYNSLAPSDGLVLSLDTANRRSYPGSGTSWFDLSGNGNNGTLMNGASLNTGFGGGMNFDGVDDYVNCGINAIPQGTTPITVSAWANYRNHDGQSALLSIEPTSGNTFTLSIITLAGLGSFLWTDSVTQNITFSGSFPALNSWNHWGYSFNSNGSYKIYLNGSIIQQSSVTLNTASLIGGAVYIGRRVRGAAGNANVVADDIRIYNRALSREEISILFNIKRRRYGL